MLNLQDIVNQYPPFLQPFKRFMLKEYLQYKILEILFNSPYANKLVFLGGTCLRIVHDTTRFSEDLDFDNFNLSRAEFSAIEKLIQSSLEKEGYEVEVRQVIKSVFHCYIRFPKLLYDNKLSNHQEEKILIRLDTEPQNFDFKPDAVWLNKFDVFTSIFSTPLNLLLAQKFYAILNRKRNKGRDFFDVVFLLGKNIQPNYAYLDLKLGINTPKALKKKLLAHCNMLNMADMGKDVAPFLFYPKDVKKVIHFSEYLSQKMDT